MNAAAPPAAPYPRPVPKPSIDASAPTTDPAAPRVAPPPSAVDPDRGRKRSPITPVTLDRSARPCAASASRRSAASSADTSTSSVKLRLACSGDAAESVAVYV